MPSSRRQPIDQLTRQLYGEPQYLGSITATAGAPKDNGAGGGNFALDGGELLLLQGSAAFYFEPVASGSLLDTQAVLVQANEKFLVLLRNGTVTFAVDPVSGTATIKAWRLD